MFTGIITACERIKSITAQEDNEIFIITKPQNWNLSVGESVNVDGVCSTVVMANDESFTVEYMSETLEITTLNKMQENDTVNLEQSLKLSGLVSGHLVYGHIDTIGEVNQIQEQGGSYILTIRLLTGNTKYIVSKGSVTVNGVSMTVVNPKEDEFQVAVIPHTWQNTNFHFFKQGSSVNIEFDMIAKYLEKISQG